MEEEFDEMDILFPEQTNDFFDDDEYMIPPGDEPDRREVKPNQQGFRVASPINIPRQTHVNGVGFHRNKDPGSVISSRIFVPLIPPGDEPNRREVEPNQQGFRVSSPINIPGRIHDGVGFHRNKDPGSVISSRIFVPPHVILERREKRKLAFWVQPQTQYATNNQRMYATNDRIDNGRVPPIQLRMIYGRI